MKKWIIFFGVFWLNWLPNYAQSDSTKFKLSRTIEGFPSGYPYSFLKDTKGFVWFGTAQGLTRFDGVSFHTFYPDAKDSTKLYKGYIHYLFEDSKGRIWLSAGAKATRIQVFDPKEERFYRFEFTIVPVWSFHQNLAQNFFMEDSSGNIWVKDEGNGLYKIEEKTTNQFSVSKYQPSNTTLGKGITAMYIDSKGNFWAGGKNGLYIFNPVSEKLVKYSSQNTEILDFVNGIVEDHQGKLWVMFRKKGLFQLDTENHRFIKKWPLEKYNNHLSNNFIVIDNIENIWFSQYEDNILDGSQLIRYDIRKEMSFNYFNKEEDLVTYQVDLKGKFWVANIFSKKTLATYNPISESLELVRKPSSHFPVVSNFYVDINNILWVPDYRSGTLEVIYSNPKFKIFSQDTIYIFDRSPNTIFEKNDEKILVVTNDGIINYSWDNNFNVVRKKLDIKSEGLISITEDTNGIIWAGCVTGHNTANVFKISPDLNRVTKINSSDLPFTIRKIFDLNDEQLILSSSSNGIFSINKFSGIAKKLSKDFNISVIQSQKNFWFFNYNRIQILEKDNRNFNTVGRNDTEDFGDIFDVREYKKGIFWVACTYGLLLYEPLSGKKLKKYLFKDGFPTYRINKILMDEDDNLWMGTLNNGLIYFNVKREQFTIFDITDGLPSNSIYDGCRRKNGELVFTSSHGLFKFHPKKLPFNSIEPKPVFTELRLFNTRAEIDGEILSRSISYTDEIVLNHDQNVLSFNYSALSFANPAKNQYAYFMEGVDKDWNYVGNQTFASYAGLTPGKYTLNLKASNNDGLWNETPTTLKITILPPWWQTWWAYTLYGLMALGLLWYVRQYEIKRVRLTQRAAHLSEMDTFKSRFYTNITHEFRTPLTIILGLTEQIGEKVKEVSSMTKVIKRNGMNLLQLINQMLDLSKLEAGLLTVNLQQGNIIPYIRYIVESFQSLAEHKNIHLHFRSEVPVLVMDYDADKVMTIVSNLLSNAIKFTPERGHVSLVVSQTEEDHTSCFQLRVTDTGMGIPAEELPQIFDRFYQVDGSTTRKGEGTGIGLSLTKELLSLLKGSIDVKSTIWQGTEFTVMLPITHTAPREEPDKFGSTSFPIHGYVVDDLDEILTPTNESRSQPVALIVEDNMDVVYYLRTCLYGKYTLEIAQNGEDGITKAMEKIPDIIISDVMMPEKNGYELCNTLKNHERTSHIPIILLTAKAAEADKIEGLTVGADAYLTKPFNKEELKLRIKNLITQRRKLWKQYNESFAYKPQELEVSSHDQKFLTNALEVLEKHKSNPDFSPENLQKELGVSRTLLHVKLKALTGQSTTEFIRTYRLKYAAQLIRQHFGNVAQVAYEAGFNDQSYFTKSFKKHFGVAPSEYAKSATV